MALRITHLMRKKPHHSNSRPLRLGFVALADSAPLIMAEELGLYAKYGVDVELHREIGWATIRDKLIYGELDAAQAPAGLLVAAGCGLGCVQTPCLTGLVINLNGNAITLSNQLRRRGVHDGRSLREEIHRTGTPCTLGIVHRYSSHSVLLRKWLRAHHIEPDRDVHIVVVPPAQVASNLKAGHLDGYCVGEPWNSMAVMNGTGWCVATSPELAPFHPEKVLMVRSEFAERAPEKHQRLIAALLHACRFCDQPENRERIVETLAQPLYVDAPIQALQMSLCGSFDYGHGRKEKLTELHVFSRENANEPTADKASWVIRGLLESGLIPDPTCIPEDAETTFFRSDIYREAAQLITENP